MKTSLATKWPPDYTSIYAQRQQDLLRIKSDPVLLFGAKEYYRTRPVDFINHWGLTYDPRVAGSDRPTRLPFILFPRQREFVRFLQECLNDQENGLVEKSRDMGATWVCGAFSVWLWLFVDGSSVGWGSRKEQLVDRIGDPDSIFEKMRVLIRSLPGELLPSGFSPGDHMTHMKIINPETESTITGEAGDNIGRGGRKLLYFKDEAQPLDAKVLTPQGWAMMADMKVGSRVIGPDGKSRKVTHINDCGVHDVYRVTFSDGTFTECSPNHLWAVNKVHGKHQSITMRTHELADSLSVTSSGQVKYRYRVPLSAPVQFDAGPPLPLDPYVAGVLLGDGAISNENSTPRFTSMDQGIIDEVKKALPSYCVLTFNGHMGYRITDVLGRQGPGIKSRARMMVVESGIAGKLAQDKSIPDIYKFSSPENRLAILQGLMDTDGSASLTNKAAQFHTSSPKLADDVLFIVQSLGGRATINVKPDARGYRDMYRLHIAMAQPPFRLKRKLERLNRTQSIDRTIVSITKSGRRPVRCISVDADDGLYLTDHCIITHNSAHYERPEKIEAALADNTNCQIDISSVNGLGNVFHRRREAGVEWSPGKKIAKGTTRVFIMDWRDHPAKDEAWYETRRKNAVANGLLHIFAQEVDRDYSAAVDGIIIPSLWVKAAIDAHLDLGFDDSGAWGAALDVADGGGDTNALALRKGVILKSCEEWGERDTGVTARKAVGICRDHGTIDVQYDCIGVGSGIKAEVNRLLDEKLMPKNVRFFPWNAAAEVLKPEGRVVEQDKESPINKDFYGNLKAQAWWQLRRRFEKTYRALQKLDGDPDQQDFTWESDELISLPSNLPNLRKIEKELSQPTASQGARMKLIVDKTPEGTRSPNLADAIVMAFWPVNRPPMIIPRGLLQRSRHVR